VKISRYRLAPPTLLRFCKQPMLNFIDASLVKLQRNSAAAIEWRVVKRMDALSHRAATQTARW
jgi:hypothetical protein